MLLTNFLENRLQKQIRQYIEWKSVRHSTAYDELDILNDFIKKIEKKNFDDVTYNDLIFFKEGVRLSNKTAYQVKKINTCINSFFGYYRARGYYCKYFAEIDYVKTMRTKNTGRPPEVEKIYQVRELRKQQITFRQIAEILDADVRQVHRWAKYPLEKYQKIGILKV